MTRHGRNATASSVYSYHERRKDTKQSGYGTLHERLGADSIKEFDCCCLTLQPCREPVVTPEGYLFDKEAILEYILNQKKENIRKIKEYEKQKKREQEELEDQERKAKEAEIEKFKLEEGTPAHMGSYATAPDSQLTAGSSQSVSNMTGDRKRHLPAFWVPDKQPSAKDAKMEKPVVDKKILCPMSGTPIKLKDLLPVEFTPITDGDASTSAMAKKIRYMCPVTHDALTNISPCAVLKTSGKVVSMNCVDKIIKKDWVDPTNGKKMEESDVIVMQRGGTGFSSTNDVKAKLVRPALELQ